MYPVGELLAGIRGDMNKSFASLEKGLEAKADKADFARLDGRLDEHQKAGERRDMAITELKERQDRGDVAQSVLADAKAERDGWHRWLYPALVATVLALVTVLQVVGVLG